MMACLGRRTSQDYQLESCEQKYGVTIVYVQMYIVCVISSVGVWLIEGGLKPSLVKFTHY